MILGSLVAFFNKNDHYHEWAVRQFSQLDPPFLPCKSVISEVGFLLRHTDEGLCNVLALIERELIHFPLILKNEIKSNTRLIGKYKDIPM